MIKTNTIYHNIFMKNKKHLENFRKQMQRTIKTVVVNIHTLSCPTCAFDCILVCLHSPKVCVVNLKQQHHKQQLFFQLTMEKKIILDARNIGQEATKLYFLSSMMQTSTLVFESCACCLFFFLLLLGGGDLDKLLPNFSHSFFLSP